MSDWIQLTIEPIDSRPVEAFVRDALKLFERTTTCARSEGSTYDAGTEEVLQAIDDRAQRLTSADDRTWCSTVAGVICDLFQQGWSIQFRRHHLWGQRSIAGSHRDALRQRLLVRRDAQLAKESVRKFVRNMEQWRLHDGTRTSVLSLMRDGRELASALESGTPVAELVIPYLQFVAPNGICEWTGLRTQDIWRYFRHTWASPYESVPGRSMQFLVRDRAVPLHPVIGIGALSSAAVRLGPRDRYIGWDTEQVLDRLLGGDREVTISWALRVVKSALDEIYVVDFVRDNLLPADPKDWTLAHAQAIAHEGALAKEQHHRLMAAQEYKAKDDVSTEEACVIRAQLPLFRAKRALELARLIPILLQLRQGLPEGSEGRDMLSKIVRIARSKSVGTEIADLTVCGAIAPYSHLAAGKLVAMLALSPQVIAEYKRRYHDSPGIIASSMAGRPVGRSANLCYIGTTSLYGKRPNQYDRLAMPARFVGGKDDMTIRYSHIQDDNDSRTQGVGTFHFSSRTLKGLERFVSRSKGGWKANNLFGEGTSPKLRGLRDGLLALGLDADELLVHGIERCMYGVKLADNVDRYLLGMDPQPHWLIDPLACTNTLVSDWWAKRWGEARAAREDVRAQIRAETLAYPIRHRARVRLPE